MNEKPELTRPADGQDDQRKRREDPDIPVPLNRFAEPFGLVVNNPKVGAPKHNPQMARQIFPRGGNVIVDRAQLLRAFDAEPDKRKRDDQHRDSARIFEPTETPDQPAREIKSELRSQRPVKTHDRRLSEN